MRTKTGATVLEEARAHHAGAKRRVPADQLTIQAGPPALEARVWSPRRTQPQEVSRR